MSKKKKKHNKNSNSAANKQRQVSAGAQKNSAMQQAKPKKAGQAAKPAKPEKAAVPAVTEPEKLEVPAVIEPEKADVPAVAEPEKADVPAVKEPEKPKAQKQGKKKALIIIAACVAVLAAVFGILLLTHKVVWLKSGLLTSGVESIARPVAEGETAKLNWLTNLKEADLSGSTNYKEIYAWACQHPDIAVRYDVFLPEGSGYSEETQTADLSALSREDALAAAADHASYIRDLKAVKLDLSKWSVEQLKEFSTQYPEWDIIGSLTLKGESVDEYEMLLASYPDVEFNGTLDICGSSVEIGSEKVEIAQASDESLAQTEKLISLMPGISSIDMGADDEGYSMLSKVFEFSNRHPDITVDYRFSFFDKLISMNAEKLDLHKRKMYDQGEEVRQIIACMPKLTWLDMDSCGVDDEHMAAIRDDFPNIKVVWRVWFGGCYSVRTDAIKILASAPLTAGSLTPYNSRALKYCTDIKYLDLGHNEELQTIDFVQYMPNLEVFIVMWGDIHDISPLKNCPHLEFFEVFTNWITDLSPLSEMHELKHLNICHNPRLRDLSPIYGLTQLERLWIGGHTGIPKSQIEEFRKLAPDCEVNDWVGDAHTNWRGDHPRYQLLRQQMGYHYPDGPAEYSFYWNDPLYYSHEDMDLEWNSVKTDQ